MKALCCGEKGKQRPALFQRRGESDIVDVVRQMATGDLAEDRAKRKSAALTLEVRLPFSLLESLL